MQLLYLYRMQLLIEEMTLPQRTSCMYFLHAQLCVHMLVFSEPGNLEDNASIAHAMPAEALQ